MASFGTKRYPHRIGQCLDAAQHFFTGLDREFKIPGAHGVPPRKIVSVTNIATG
jgi:hypothetical protein